MPRLHIRIFHLDSLLLVDDVFTAQTVEGAVMFTLRVVHVKVKHFYTKIFTKQKAYMQLRCPDVKILIQIYFCRKKDKFLKLVDTLRPAKYVAN